MDEADDDYPGPPLLSGQRQHQRPAMSQHQLSLLDSLSPQQQRHQVLDSHMQSALELYQHRQLELQRDIQMRQRLMMEQQLLSELDQQQQLQQLQQAQLSSPLRQRPERQWLYDPQQFASPTQRSIQVNEEIEQLYLQQQQERQRELFFRQQQVRSQQQQQLLARRNPYDSDLCLPERPTTGTNPQDVSDKWQHRQIQQSRQIQRDELSKNNFQDITSQKEDDSNVSNDEEDQHSLQPEILRSKNSHGTPSSSPSPNYTRKEYVPEQNNRTISNNDQNFTVLKGSSEQKDDNTNPECNIYECLSEENHSQQKTPTKERNIHQDDKQLKPQNLKVEKFNDIEDGKAKSPQQAKQQIIHIQESPRGDKKHGMKRSNSEVEKGKDRMHSLKRQKDIFVGDLDKTNHQPLELQTVKNSEDAKVDTKDDSAKCTGGNTEQNQTSNGVDKDDDAKMEDPLTDCFNGIDRQYSNREIATLIANLHSSTPRIEISQPPEPVASNQKVTTGFMSAFPELPIEPVYQEQYEEEEGDMGGNEDRIHEEYYSERQVTDGVFDPQFGTMGPPGDLQQFPPSNTMVHGPVVISRLPAASFSDPAYNVPVDTWWPSNGTIKRERRMRGYKSEEDESAGDDDDDGIDLSVRPRNSFSKLSAMKRERAENPLEPGVLEKIPHCRIHRLRQQQDDDGTISEPMFCWEVTENYPTDVMVCCSICSTWRHAFCGGHYKYTGHSTTNSNSIFIPICDRCYEEEKYLCDNPKIQSLVERQRTEHLRRTLATAQVIRHSAYAKHGGTYKWPLGSVSATHIGGHTRSVHARHERAEKQWSEMAMKLGNGLGYRPKERVKVRTRELERLLVNVEDSELFTDRHNMMLFLQRDTGKERPAGYEKSRGNFFDPDDDEQYFVNLESSSGEGDKGEDEKENFSKNGNDNLSAETEEVPNEDDADACDSSDTSDTKSVNEEVLSETSDDDNSSKSGDEKENDEESAHSKHGSKSSMSVDENDSRADTQSNSSSSAICDAGSKSSDEIITTSTEEEEELRPQSPPTCAKPSCRRKPRYDSLFCSDSCGVCALELDLIRSLDYANIIHPSLLRS